jgi:peptidoglycan-N-acetylglucosamine deacetylase
MRFFRPLLFQILLYPEAVFRIKTTEKILCLTFDDGPDPLSTEILISILGKYNIKALFFCEGRKAQKYTELINLLKSAGHIIGNHGYNHPDGLFVSDRKYIEDVKLASGITSEKLFRPPYGRMRIGQYLKLRKDYRIIMWDLMPYDFDTKFGSGRTLETLKKKIRPGSIIVLHDKTNGNKLEYIEDFFLFAMAEGYRFDLSGLLDMQNN